MPEPAPMSTAGKIGGLRPGLIATALGAVTLVGAVWSWTSKPEPTPAAQASAPISHASSQEGELPAKVENSRAAEIRADVKLAARNPEAMAKQPQQEASASPEEADKAAKPAEPPAKPGTVKLAIQPWGEIYVDGGKRGVSPPMKSLSLAPGKHRIEIRNGDFAPYKETIEVKSGGETTVQYVF